MGNLICRVTAVATPFQTKIRAAVSKNGSLLLTARTKETISIRQLMKRLEKTDDLTWRQ
jgi:hypothetical protein